MKDDSYARRRIMHEVFLSEILGGQTPLPQLMSKCEDNIKNDLTETSSKDVH
jgi:hypothetical protein